MSKEAMSIAAAIVAVVEAVVEWCVMVGVGCAMMGELLCEHCSTSWRSCCAWAVQACPRSGVQAIGLVAASQAAENKRC